MARVASGRPVTRAERRRRRETDAGSKTVAPLPRMGVQALQRLPRSSGIADAELVAEMRLDEEGRLLANSGLSIARIGCKLGTSNPSNFARAFRSMIGEPPHRYRSRTLGGNQAQPGQ